VHFSGDSALREPAASFTAENSFSRRYVTVTRAPPEMPGSPLGPVRPCPRQSMRLFLQIFLSFLFSLSSCSYPFIQVVARKHFVPPYPDVVLFRLRWGEHPQSDRTTRSLLSVYLIHQTTPVVSLFNRSVHWFQTDGTVYSPLCALVSARNSQPAAPLRDCVLAHLFIRP
jgi:hypothetical protein